MYSEQIERDRAEVARFDEEFKSAYGHYPAGHDYGDAGVPETAEEHHARRSNKELSKLQGNSPD